jgi:hypothetical protein
LISQLFTLQLSDEPTTQLKPSANPVDEVVAHTRAGNDHRIWAKFAQALLAARAILRRKRERDDESSRIWSCPKEMLTVWIEPMLTSFGIECLVKAVWVKQGHEIARDGKYITIVKDEGHRLVPLCKEIGIPINNRERDTLQRISAIARSIGRYPIPLRSSEPQCDWSSEDDRVIANFVLRLKTQLRKRAQPKDSDSEHPKAVRECGHKTARKRHARFLRCSGNKS